MGNNNIIKENIIQAVLQVALIVFSVVLGLYLSERIEERKSRQESATLLAIVTSEVKDNIKLMENWVPYHQEIHKNLDSLSKDEEFIAAFIKDKSIFFKPFTRGTIMGESPANDAWDIAKSHPLIVNIEYDKLLILSKIYSQQQSTFEPMEKMVKLFQSKDVNIEKDAQSNLESLTGHMHELVARELQLMYYYKQAEEGLDLQNERRGIK